MRWPKTLGEWAMTVTIAVVVAVALILPVYVIRTVNEQALLSREDRVRVNVATIACLYQSDPDTEFSPDVLRECIDDALAAVESP